MCYDWKQHKEASMVLYNFKISTQEAEAGGFKAREAWEYTVRTVWKYKTEKHNKYKGEKEREGRREGGGDKDRMKRREVEMKEGRVKSFTIITQVFLSPSKS